MATTKFTDLSLVRRQAIMELVDDREGTLEALARCIEERLCQRCDDGREPPDDAPLTEWRLAQTLLQSLESAQYRDAVKAYLELDKETIHG